MHNPNIPQNPVTVAAIDDEEIVGRMIAKFLANQPGIRFQGCYEDIEKAVAAINQCPPNVILLDWNLKSGLDRLGGVEYLRRQYPSSRILIFTGFGDEETAIPALTTGADGYLLKSASAPELIDAVIRATAGQNPLSPSITTKLIRFVRSMVANQSATPPTPANGVRVNNETLTSRERAVMDFICKGESTKKIAELMGVTIHTIRFHLRNIYDKLGAHSQTEAVLSYLRLN